MRLKIFEFNIVPIGKPRMTQRDKWKPSAKRYWSFKDDLNWQAKAKKFTMPECNYHLKFYIPMPSSWSAKKKLAMVGQPHKQTPDKDNLEKAFLDALCESDSHIWDGRASKKWAYQGKIEVEVWESDS